MLDFFSNPYIIVPLLVWSLAWKGLALWRAAKNDSVPWFVAILVINTLGILEILYLYFPKSEKVKESK